MQIIPEKLRPAQDEVRKAAHNQDLVEVPRRARLDRAAEARTFKVPAPAVHPIKIPGPAAPPPSQDL